jgi:hypothetical protein
MVETQLPYLKATDNSGYSVRLTDGHAIVLEFKYDDKHNVVDAVVEVIHPKEENSATAEECSCQDIGLIMLPRSFVVVLNPDGEF